jgi:hypothetical protein
MSNTAFPDTTDSYAPDFTPVRLQRVRHDGWTEPRQRCFVEALAVTGSVEAAARMVRMSRKSAYALRSRPDAGSFALAWDEAVSIGRMRLFDAMMDRATNGVTTLTLRLGGAVDIKHGIDGRLIASQVRAELARNVGLGVAAKATQGDIR